MTPEPNALPNALPLAEPLDRLIELAIAPSWSRAGLRRPAPPLPLGRRDRPPRLAGRVVVLTGFTSGIGLAAARPPRRGGRRAASGGPRRRQGARPGRRACGRTGAASPRAWPTSPTSTTSAGWPPRSRPPTTASTCSSTTPAPSPTAGPPPPRASRRPSRPRCSARSCSPTLLRERLEQAGPGARVLTMSSGGMYAERLVVDDLEMGPDGFEGPRAYARAKRAQVELTAEWARRGTGIGGVPRPAPGLGRHPRGGGEPPPLPRPDPADPAHARRRGPTPWSGWPPPLPPPSDATAASGSTAGAGRPHKVPWTHAPAGERARLWAWCEQRTGLTRRRVIRVRHRLRSPGEAVRE